LKYEVRIKKAAKKGIAKAPSPVQDAFVALMLDLEAKGPIQPAWPNYSKLGPSTYHCHLARKWVACWSSESGSIIVEVYYAGSRESSPY
jgi:hypothetical protein